MSLLEGHASYVMNEVARDHVADVDRMRRALAGSPSWLERGARHPEGDRVRAEDPAVRRRRAVRPRGDRDARAWTSFNRVWVAPDQPAHARRDRRARALGRARRGLARRAAPARRRACAGAGHRHRPRARHVPARRPVLVEVSGGPDSVCLLESLGACAGCSRSGSTVVPLRPPAARWLERHDAAYVRRLADRLGLPFHVRVAETPRPPASRPRPGRARPSPVRGSPTSLARSTPAGLADGTPATTRPRRS